MNSEGYRTILSAHIQSTAAKLMALHSVDGEWPISQALPKAQRIFFYGQVSHLISSLWSSFSVTDVRKNPTSEGESRESLVKSLKGGNSFGNCHFRQSLTEKKFHHSIQTNYCTPKYLPSFSIFSLGTLDVGRLTPKTNTDTCSYPLLYCK